MIEFNAVIEDPRNISAEFPASMTPLSFLSGGSRVLGTLFIPGGSGTHRLALLLNGFPGNEVNFDIAHMLQRMGLFVFTFNFRGSWGSGGIYCWNNLLEDPLEALRFLRGNPVKERYHPDLSNPILIGYSFGGFSALINAARLDEVKNVCAIAPFNAGFTGGMLEISSEARIFVEQRIQNSIEFVNCSDAGSLVSEIIEHKSDWNLINHAEALSKKNILLIGAKYDSTSPVELNHKPLVGALKSAGALKLDEHLLETGHSFSDRRIELMKIINGWINKTNCA
jgi:uncharacterized protein